MTQQRSEKEGQAADDPALDPDDAHELHEETEHGVVADDGPHLHEHPAPDEMPSDTDVQAERQPGDEP